MRVSIYSRWLVAAGITAGLTFSAGNAFATVDKCTAGLEKAAAKLSSDTSKNLSKCIDSIRKEQVKGAKGSLVKGAAACEKALSAIYNTTKSAMTTFRAACAKLGGTTCTDADLTDISHLSSGASGAAPPAAGATIQFACDYLGLQTEETALQQQIAQVPDMFAVLGAARGAGTCPTDNPTLCNMGFQCKTHSCTTVNSASALTSGGLFGSTLNFPLSGNNAVTICRPKGNMASYGQANFAYLAGPPALTLNPVIIPGGITVCVNVLRSAGWCDCTGQGVKFNTDLCQDRIVSGGTLPDGCSSNGPNTADTQGYAGTLVGRVKPTPSGASGAGDCINFFTTQFSIHTSSATFGIDTVACSSDDTVTPAAPAGVPLTTGTATATTKDMVTGPGGCSNDGNINCIEDINCGAGNTCDNPAPGLTDATLAQGPGSKGTCAQYESSNLSNIAFVGAFPAAGGAAPLGDTVTAFRLECQ